MQCAAELGDHGTCQPRQCRDGTTCCELDDRCCEECCQGRCCCGDRCGENEVCTDPYGAAQCCPETTPYFCEGVCLHEDSQFFDLRYCGGCGSVPCAQRAGCGEHCGCCAGVCFDTSDGSQCCYGPSPGDPLGAPNYRSGRICGPREKCCRDGGCVPDDACCPEEKRCADGSCLAEGDGGCCLEDRCDGGGCPPCDEHFGQLRCGGGTWVPAGGRCPCADGTTVDPAVACCTGEQKCAGGGCIRGGPGECCPGVGLCPGDACPGSSGCCFGPRCANGSCPAVDGTCAVPDNSTCPDGWKACIDPAGVQTRACCPNVAGVRCAFFRKSGLPFCAALSLQCQLEVCTN